MNKLLVSRVHLSCNMFILIVTFTMDVSEAALVCNKDWDPSYLRDIFDSDFHDFSELWANSVGDMELLHDVESVERYCPEVEDISLDDESLVNAVTEIENE